MVHETVSQVVGHVDRSWSTHRCTYSRSSTTSSRLSSHCSPTTTSWCGVHRFWSTGASTRPMASWLQEEDPIWTWAWGYLGRTLPRPRLSPSPWPSPWSSPSRPSWASSLPSFLWGEECTFWRLREYKFAGDGLDIGLVDNCGEPTGEGRVLIEEGGVKDEFEAVVQGGDGRDVGESDTFTDNIDVFDKVVINLDPVFHLCDGISFDSLVERKSGSNERKNPSAQIQWTRPQTASTAGYGSPRPGLCQPETSRLYSARLKG